ncbi:MAG: hypothetical protein HYR60_28765 [Acidobacteria bacterium]|nr:hypothetical protein [Acidobacteriota bacterium]
MWSIEGSFIAISRYAAQNFGDWWWWPLWFCGMPYQNVYGPLLHHLVAAVAAAARISPALAFHAVSALFYCLGPVTLFWMAWRLSGSRACGYWAGLLYSLISPAALLIPVIRAELGGAFHLRRLFNLVVYGESPHVAALTLLPLALVALDAALVRKRTSGFAMSAIALAGVVLTNVTGSVGLGMAVLSYLLAKPREEWRSSLFRTGLIGLAAYGLSMPWIPPSTLRLISWNAQSSAGQTYPFTARHILYFGVIIGGAILLRLVFSKLRMHPFLRFSLLLTFFSAAITLPGYWIRVAVLPQPERFQLELELGCCLAARFAIARGLGRLPGFGPAAVLTVLCLAGMVYHRRQAAELIQPIDIRSTTEYKAAAWFDQHMRGRRVFAPGSVSFWMNVFTDTPQLGGCCDQGVPHWQQRVALHTIYTGQNLGVQEGEISRLWLQAYGVHAVGVTGPDGGEAYKPFRNPKKFEGLLPALWRDGGDVIYGVPQSSDSLAHVIREEHVVSRGPKDGMDVGPIEPYVAALNDPQLPLAPLEWTSRASARVAAHLRPGDLLSVQVSYHPGWRALVDGSERRVRSDALGMMLVDPECSGACTVSLVYDGGLEMRIARAVQILSAAGCLILLLRTKYR